MLTFLATLLVLPAQLDEEAVRAGYAEALAAVTELLEPRLDPAPALRFVTARELGQCVAEENEESLARQLGDPEQGAAQAAQVGAQFAQFAYAKYSWSAKEFLVVLPNWNGLARRFDRIELTEDEAVRAVLVHELAHALDDQVHDIGARMLACPDTDHVQGFNAVLEGHAQLQTRRVCAARGWSDGFDVFTELISAIPPGLDEATLQLTRVQVATVATAYTEGERFLATLLERAGPEAVTRAFRNPPDAQTVFHPGWFLDPSTRPVPRYDPEPALAHFEARFPEEHWSRTRLGLTPAQVSAALALLEPATVAPIQANLLSARLTSLQPRSDPASKQVLMAVFEFQDEASAKAYLAAARELGRIKDERMTKGFVRILSAQYEDFTGSHEGVSGFLATKRIAAGGDEIQVTTVDAQRGVLVLETLLSGEALERDAHLALVLAALGTLQAR